jgi:LmbE family N-acetylglucosaminyl deacetylase
VATIVAFHAHPDNEVLLTGGTIARLAAEGNRVIIVVACDGDVWASPGQGRRLEELRASAATDRPCPYFALSAGQNGSPNPGNGQANSSPAIRRPGPADRTSTQVASERKPDNL